ncbi:MAG: hypothetical protein P1P59_09365 [Treponemataceae bacterium]
MINIMFYKTKKSLSKINYKLFLSLIITGFVPTIYTTVRIFFLGDLPSEYSLSIAGQLSWVNLLYEILNEAIVLPLYFFMGQVLSDKKEFSNRIRTGLIICVSAYTILSIFVIALTEPLLSVMATDKTIIDASATYIRIESIANIFSLAFSFIIVSLVTLNKEKYFYILTGVNLVLCLMVDTFIVSTLPISLNLGVNGIAISNIIVNVFLILVAIVVLNKEGIKIFSKEKLSFSWVKGLAKIGGISGFESFVRNIAYMLMIIRMVNKVGEQGTFWVANNFIWGWLLLPILQLGELIKRETSTDKNAVKNNSLGYFTITMFVCILWCFTIPLWKPFMTHVLNFNAVDKLYELVLISLGFYVLFALQNVFDSTFYGLGKTHYMLFESVVTNVIFYGGAFILYLYKVWTPSLIGIALMFGLGNAFDGIVSLAAYIFLLKKNRINILNIE